MMQTRTAFAAACSLTLLVSTVGLTGCGSSDASSALGVVPVSVTIMYKDVPVEGAQVTFVAVSGTARNASGTTDSQGKCSLTTINTDDGAIPGEYKVSVGKTKPDAATSALNDPGLISGEDPNKAKKGGQSVGQQSDPYATYLSKVGSKGDLEEDQTILPEKYADPGTSPLKFTVVADSSNDFTIKLAD